MQKKTMFPFVFSLICTNFADKSTKKYGNRQAIGNQYA